MREVVFMIEISTVREDWGILSAGGLLATGAFGSFMIVESQEKRYADSSQRDGFYNIASK